MPLHVAVGAYGLLVIMYNSAVFPTDLNDIGNTAFQYHTCHSVAIFQACQIMGLLVFEPYDVGLDCPISLLCFFALVQCCYLRYC